MTELTKKILGGLIRLALAPLMTWLVQHGVISSDETVQFAAEVASWAIAISWTILAWVRAHRKQLTAAAMPKGSTLNEVNAQLRSGETPALSTGQNEPTKIPTQ